MSSSVVPPSEITFLLSDLVRQHDRVEECTLLFRPLEMCLGVFVRNDDCTLILERFTAGDVIEVGVAVN